MKPLHDCRLYGFVDTAYLHGRSPAKIATELCEGGVDLIQLRAKENTPAEVEGMAGELADITRKFDVGLVINDHLSVALACGANFCHLGQEDFFDAGFTRVSELFRPGQPEVGIGLSTHSIAQCERALAARPAYVAIGPVFATGTKPQARPVTLDYVRWAAIHVSIPWFAIGGITLANLDSVLEAGARRVCVVSAILNSASIVKTCQQWKDRLLSAPA